MKLRIAFLSAKHYCDYIKQLIHQYDITFSELETLDFYEYNSISELPALYKKVYDRYDGFCVTGNFSKELIIETCSLPSKPLHSLFAHSLDYFREFFYLVNKNRGIDFKRVIIDFSLWINYSTSFSVATTVDDFVSTNLRFIDVQEKILEHTTLDEILHAEKTIVDNASLLVREKKIDHIVCRFSTSYPMLKEQKIPCSFIYPAIDTFMDTMYMLISDIRLTQMNLDLPAVIYVTSETLLSSFTTNINTNNLSIQQCLLDFNSEHTAGLMIRETLNGYEIYTTQQIIKKITDNFTNCRLNSFIFGRTGLDVQVGYGIGDNVMKAQDNASSALKLAQRNKKSYIVNQNGLLIGPMDLSSEKEEQDIPDNIIKASKKSGLSLSTIQRILSALDMLGTKEITTRDLATSLQVTVANANRFLNVLLKHGYAEIISEKKSLSRGRPSRIYKILL